MNLFPTAFAEEAGTSVPAGAPNASPESGITMIALMVVAMFVLYFVMVRPKNKERKQYEKIIASLKKGDEILTVGGIIGRITKIDGDYFTVAINDTSSIMIKRSYISSVLPKGTMKDFAVNNVENNKKSVK